MEAPSERHLEDWIFNNYKVANVRYEDVEFVDAVFDSIIARQIPVTCGIIDLIGIHSTAFYVTELKKGRIDSAALTQVLRYRSEIDALWNGVYHDICDFNPELVHALNRYVLRGMLIGHSIDASTRRAAQGADVEVVLYEYEPVNNIYDLRYPEWLEGFGRSHDTCRDVIRQAFQQLVVRDYNAGVDHE